LGGNIINNNFKMLTPIFLKENVLKHNRQTIIPKGGINSIFFAWYFIGIICARAFCPTQHTLPPHENILLHSPFCTNKKMSWININELHLDFDMY
jgi:hypothetical protein